MPRLVLIDGNSILNRAFYGIMTSKMLMTEDGTYTNAIYGFLSIMFKIIDDLTPEYMAVAFDLKAPTARHKLYEGYKATRHAMPNELAAQMPILKNVLRAMNITIIEKEGYEADDIIGTLSRVGENADLDVTILSGDRDNFQLITDKVVVRIPHTKAGKTEVEDFTVEKVKEKYELMPKDLIEVKGLMGDSSDNIPGVPGVGEKTALSLVKQFGTIENLYKVLEEGTDGIKGKARERLVENKELAFLSKTLGTINLQVPVEEKIEDLKLKEWNKEEVVELFRKLKFNRFMDRFGLKELNIETKQNKKKEVKFRELKTENEVAELLNKTEKLIYYLGTEESLNEELIIKKNISNISIYNEKTNEISFIDLKENEYLKLLKPVFENKKIPKIGFKLKEDYILLKQNEINLENISFDIVIAAYIINSSKPKYTLEELSEEYIEFSIDEYLKENNVKEEATQINLFDTIEVVASKIDYKSIAYAYAIKNLQEKLETKIIETKQLDLFNKIEMPLVEVLADMQYQGIYVDKEELLEFGAELQKKIKELTLEIYSLVGEEFNINSPKQLGELLFEKLKLPVIKKTKSGYSTDVDVLEKLKEEHPAIEKILEYRQYMKLNSTYVEGLIPYINVKDSRIHSNFHQTVTITGRISSTDPNLQNIPTRIELGKKLRKVFKAKENATFIDADYSQIELRILAHISEDENMIEAFNNGEDIHKQAASKVLGIPLEEVTKEERSKAKAVNFGIVYGISDFGLAEQIGVSKKQAKQYIEQYLEKYSGIKKFMDDITEKAKQDGYVETLYNRRRYIPELKSNNYMVRQFGARVAMNTPIQGTAADVIKIAMIDVYNTLKQRKLKSKLLLQVHDELLIETEEVEKEEVIDILKTCMERAINLKVPLIADLSEAKNWYEAK